MHARRTAAMLLALAAACGAGHATAHESWLEPSSFEIESGLPIGVRVCVADGFEGWSLARDPWRIARFIAVNDAGEMPVVGLEGSDPAGVARFTRSGDYVIAYERHRALLEVPAEEFEAFLREKGLEHVIRMRAKRRMHAATVREAYTRHSKALVRVGDDGVLPADRPIGMALELIAESARTEVASGARTFRLLHRGRPLADALVVAARLGTADRELKARTDSDGRVRFVLGASGLWRIASVHMIEAPRNAGAEFESHWTSLSLEMPPSAGESARRAAPARTPCSNRLAPPALSARS